MIRTAAELKQVVSEILEMGSVALDTEFFWERTFYPRLGVVQLGLPDGRCLLVDAPAVGGFEPGGLQPLGRLLSTRQVEKILHDAPQDLAILRRATGAFPRNIFDTRCAAGFIGLESTISLGNLLDQLLGIRLSKSETRADWLRRPLTRRQVAYAEDDVRHLHQAREVLEQRAVEGGVNRWLQQELKGLDDPALYEDRDPRLQFTRIKGVGRLSSRELAVLRELTAWREEVARQRDLPRGRVLADKALMHLARVQPDGIRSLTGPGRISERTARRSGEAILRAVEDGLAVPEAHCPPRSRGRRRNGIPGDLLEQALELLRSSAEERGIDPQLVGSRAEVKALLAAGDAASTDDQRLLRGWRLKLVGSDLKRLRDSFGEARE